MKMVNRFLWIGAAIMSTAAFAASINFGGTASVVALVTSDGNPVTSANPMPVTPASGSSVLANIQATNGDALTDTANALDINVKSSSISNQSVNVAQVNGTTTPVGTGAQGAGVQRVTVATDSATVAGSASLPAGSNVIGHVINDSGSVTALVPATTGGLLTYILEPAASDNHAVIKNGAGQVYAIHTFNNSATVNYMRLYNAGTGFNGCNSATNLAWEGHIPSNSTSDAGFVISIPQGLAFSTGISICVTSTYGQTSTVNATASAISIDVLYD